MGGWVIGVVCVCGVWVDGWWKKGEPDNFKQRCDTPTRCMQHWTYGSSDHTSYSGFVCSSTSGFALNPDPPYLDPLLCRFEASRALLVHLGTRRAACVEVEKNDEYNEYDQPSKGKLHWPHVKRGEGVEGGLYRTQDTLDGRVLMQLRL